MNGLKREAESPALVLLTEGAGGLWDRESLELVGRLEERVACYVTFASRRAAAPSIGDAVAACRFMGSRDVVVVDVSDATDLRSVVFPGEVIAVERAEATTSAVERAYHAGCITTQAVAV
jgi:hypothetical protein